MNTLIKNSWSKPHLVNTDFSEVQLLTQISALKDNQEKISERKPLNICFVFDVSSSMNMVVSGAQKTSILPTKMRSPIDMIRGYNEMNSLSSGKTKLDLVKQAALVALAGLDKKDIVSIVTFGSEAKVLSKGVKGDQQKELSQVIKSINCNGMTALFDGWSCGASCVAENMKEGYLNRVMLLTDGEANVGLTQADDICTKVRALSDNDVTTSTFGVGDSYNEDLLQGMSESGDANYYYIKGEEDFEAMFSHEFGGLVNLVGRKVLLSIASEGWKNFELLNSFEKNEQGFYRLPNLTTLNSLDLIFEGVPENKEAVINIEISFDSENGINEKLKNLIKLDIVKKQSDVYINQNVVDKMVLIKVANKKQEAIKALDMGNRELAQQTLGMARGILATASANVSMTQDTEISSLTNSLISGDNQIFRKSAAYQSYNVRNNKSK